MGASSFFKNDNKTNLVEQEYIDKIVDIQRRRGNSTINTWWNRWKEDTTNRDDFPTYFERNN